MITFSNFYRKHHNEVMRYITTKLGRDEAEDVTQDIFTKILSNWNRIDASKGSHRTYLFRVVRHVLIDKYTSKNRKRIYMASVLEDHKEDVSGYIPMSANNPLTTLINSEYATTFRKELNKLSEKEYKIAKLHFVEGYNQQQIHSSTDIPMSTVYSSLSRIKKQIRQCI